MAAGRTNVTSTGTGGLKSGSLVAYFGQGWTASAASGSPSNTIAGYSRDYISGYSSKVFTVKKAFTGTAYIYGKGNYKSGSGGAGRKVTYALKKTASGTTTTLYSGTLSANGSGSTSGSVTFAAGNTFTLTLATDGSGNTGAQAGVFIKI